MPDWRSEEYLKKMRQSVTCPFCGALVSTTEGYAIHKAWHDSMNAWVQQIADNFQIIFDYVTNPDTGLEDRLQELIAQVSTALDTLRDDATNAITGTNDAVTALRHEATQAITDLANRTGTIETEFMRPGGILERLGALEVARGIAQVNTQAIEIETPEKDNETK